MKVRLDIYRSVFNFAIICTALADSVNLDNSRQINEPNEAYVELRLACG